MSFNLVKDPWIRAMEKDSGIERIISLEEAFKNSQKYLCLSGDMKFQDLAVMRFMLAILTTVYTRFDAGDNPYEWIELDDDMRFVRLVDEYDEDDLFDTWERLYGQGHFSDAVVEYLYKMRSICSGNGLFIRLGEKNTILLLQSRFPRGKALSV